MHGLMTQAKHPPAASNLGWFMLCMLALLAANFAMNFSKIGVPFLDIQAYIAGNEATPFQWRCLMRPVFRVLLATFDPTFIAHLPKLTPEFLKDPLRLSYFLVNGSCIYMAMVFHWLAARAHFLERNSANLSTLVFALVCYFVFVLNPNLGYLLPYDIPALALGGAGIWLVLSGRYLVATLMFPIAVLNRETAFMVPVLLACMAIRGQADKRAWPHVAVMLLSWVVVKWALAQAFKGAAEGSEIKLFYNVVTSIKPWQWPALLPLLFMVVVSARAALSSERERAIGTAAVAGFVALAVVAVIVETRAFGDLAHLFALCMSAALVRSLSGPAPSPQRLSA